MEEAGIQGQLGCSSHDVILILRTVFLGAFEKQGEEKVFKLILPN